MREITRTAIVTLLGLGFALSAAAEKVYRHVDPEGRVTYSSEPVKGPGEATTIEVDTERNVIGSETTPELERLEDQQRIRRNRELQEQRQLRNEMQQRRAEAEERLQRAEQAWQEGQATQPGDFIGRKDGGVRPSPQRLQRLQQLEHERQAAQQALDAF